MKRIDYKKLSVGRGVRRAFGRRETAGRAGEKRGFAPRHRNRGTVLIISMWIVIFLAGLVISFSWSSRVDLVTTANYVSSLQAEATVRSAIRVLNYYAGEMAGEHIDPEYPPGEFVDAGEGFYWFIRRDPADESRITYGIYDESSKININTATEGMLEMLPGMTESIAAAIVEWRGREGREEESAVEIDSYLFLPEPYQMKRAPFETVEELLLVQGMTPDILYGDDYHSGIFRYITAYSVEPNLTSDGEERININDSDREPLLELLGEVIEDETEIERISNMLQGSSSFSNLIDFYVSSEMSPENFIEIEDRLTTSDTENIRGRINVLTAPRPVLLCLSGLDEDDVDALIAARDSVSGDPLSVTWITEAIAEDKAVAIGDLITIRSFQFSAEIAATGRDGRAFQRYRVVVDARDDMPRLVYRKNITHQGWPLDMAILENM